MAHLTQIEAVNPSINAVVQLVSDRALAEAKTADQLTLSGDPLPPLHGVPITLKDSIDTAGIVTTYGTIGRKHFIPTEDATVARRLRQAGAIILGKTNTPEFTLGGEIDNPVYGKTFNPYSLSHSPGSSSGGSAAIVAAGGSAFDLGSDTGGSIREPAHFCGLAGLKPSAGRVSRMGHAVPFGCGLGDSLTTIGPLARSVADLELILSLIEGPDGIDYTIKTMRKRKSAEVSLKDLRIAYYTGQQLVAMRPEISRMVQAVASALADAGSHLKEDQPDGIETSSNIYGWLQYADEAQWLWNLLKKAGTSADQVGPNLITLLTKAKAADVPTTTDILRAWHDLQTRGWRWFQEYDAIVCPVSPNAALPHGAVLNMTAAEAGKSWGMMSYYNLTGWPAGVVRAGTTADGLPIGVQIVARPGRDDVVLNLLRFIEKQ